MSDCHIYHSKRYKGRIQMIRSLCTLIEEREDSDDEETEQEGQRQERPEDAADFQIILRLSQEADIDCGHYGAYHGQNIIGLTFYYIFDIFTYQ